MKSLIIKKQYLDKIFLGIKVWELRGSNTKIRGRIRLIESGSGLIIGEADLIDCVGPLSTQDLSDNFNKTQYDVNNGMIKYKKTYAWVLANVHKYNKPIPYKHPQGAIIWVNT
jgi:hypothetical protein